MANANANSTASHTGQPKYSGGMAITMPAKPIIEPMREIELAGDHQQTRADGDDAEVGRDLRPVDDAVGVEHAGIARR